MKVIEKIVKKSMASKENENVTIAFFGDSVTQGCFELYLTSPESVDTVYESHNGYTEDVRKILSLLFPNVPLNIINAGISGGNIQEGYDRLERDVLRYSPDLAIICFGLNDCKNGPEGVLAYTEALDKIVEELKKRDIEIIFMTPNMMCTYQSERIDIPFIKDWALEIMERQNSGYLTAYVEAAKELCKKENIPVCDCYAKWMKMAESGVNTTNLLSNYLNHPKREMHWLFAYSLVETMFS